MILETYWPSFRDLYLWKLFRKNVVKYERKLKKGMRKFVAQTLIASIIEGKKDCKNWCKRKFLPTLAQSLIKISQYKFFKVLHLFLNKKIVQILNYFHLDGLKILVLLSMVGYLVCFSFNI